MRKPSFIILVMFTVLWFSVSIVLFLVGNDERKRRFAAEKELFELFQERDLFQERMAALKEKNSILSSELINIFSRNTEFIGLLDSHKALIRDREESLDEEKQKVLRLVLQKKRLQEKLAGLQNELEKVQNEIEELKVIYEKKKGLFIDKIVVKPSFLSQEISLKGRVLAVQEVLNFLVIDVGRAAGMRPGVVLEVLRDGSSVGILEVDKVYNSLSSATITSGSAFQIGDEVREI